MQNRIVRFQYSFPRQDLPCPSRLRACPSPNWGQGWPTKSHKGAVCWALQALASQVSCTSSVGMDETFSRLGFATAQVQLRPPRPPPPCPHLTTRTVGSPVADTTTYETVTKNNIKYRASSPSAFVEPAPMEQHIHMIAKRNGVQGTNGQE